MEKTIEKQSDTEIKITTPIVEIKSREFLKEDIVKAQASLDEFNIWASAEKTAREAVLAEKQALLDEADKVGVLEPRLIKVE